MEVLQISVGVLSTITLGRNRIYYNNRQESEDWTNHGGNNGNDLPYPGGTRIREIATDVYMFGC
jgi:hypothetical protein